MKDTVKSRFMRYVFNHKKFPEKSEQAIKDDDCIAIAREIIACEDSFWETKTINEKDAIIQHYEGMKEFFIKNFGNNSYFVEDIQSEINVLKTGRAKIDSQRRSYHDDILRIRAVFDLYEKT